MTRLPPGRGGLPLIGETFAFARNGFQFVTDRLKLHGPVFRTSVLGRKVVVMSGPDAVDAFIDPANVRRENSMPPHVQQLFAGRSLPLLDGEVHLAHKQAVLAALSSEALAGYLPAMQRIIETNARRWSLLGEFSWIEELKKLTLELICTTVAGVTDRAELDQLGRDYGLIARAFAGLPVRLPGTAYWKALQARDRILDLFRRHVAARRARPAGDGLSRLLAARASDGSALTDEEAIRELHHVVIAGFGIYAELATGIVELGRHPAVLGRLRQEVRLRSGGGALGVEQLGHMPYLLRVVMEVKRVCPILPAIFGIANRDFAFGGATVPEGWMIMWALRATNTDPASFTDPLDFDPERFAAGREEHKRHRHAFVPQGGGSYTGHRCPGTDFTTAAMSVFLIVMLRGNDWALPEQNLDYDWSVAPPEPKDHLRVTVLPV